MHEDVALALMESVPPPPAHPNCRCAIGDDGVWTDAGDDRVCPTCMLYGATWNTHLDVPMDTKEVDALLDKATRDEMREALRADSDLAGAVIRDAARFVDGGILKEIAPQLGTALPGAVPDHILIERAIVKAIGDARAAAPLPVGQAAPEAVVIVPQSKGRVAYRFVSVVVASNPTHRILRRNGQYLVQSAAGATLFTEDDLALALLILALLAKKASDQEEAKRTREGYQGQ